MVGRRLSPALTLDEAHSYINTVKETFHDQPSKYVEFIKLLNGVRDNRYGFFTFGFIFITKHCVN